MGLLLFLVITYSPAPPGFLPSNEMKVQGVMQKTVRLGSPSFPEPPCHLLSWFRAQ